MGILGTFGGGAFVSVADTMGLEREATNYILGMESLAFRHSFSYCVAAAATSYGEQRMEYDRKYKRHKPVP